MIRRRFNQQYTDAGNYMTLIPENDAVFTCEKDATALIKKFMYSVDFGKWESVVFYANSASYNVAKGKTIRFKARGFDSSEHNPIRISCTTTFSAIGNILSLCYFDDAKGKSSIGKGSSFYGLFKNSLLSYVSPDFLPATTLTLYCYEAMFKGCTLLTSGPNLPASTLSDSCYRDLFKDCSKLNYIKMLATDISAYECLEAWVSGVSPTGTFVKNPEATWDVVGVGGVPSGWTVKFDGEEDEGG